MSDPRTDPPHAGVRQGGQITAFYWRAKRCFPPRALWRPFSPVKTCLIHVAGRPHCIQLFSAPAPRLPDADLYSERPAVPSAGQPEYGPTRGADGHPRPRPLTESFRPTDSLYSRPARYLLEDTESP